MSIDESRLIQKTGNEYDILLDNNGSGLLYNLSGRLVYIGTVPTYASLPSTAQEGDMYFVTALNAKYFYNNGAWEPLGDATVSVPVDSALSTTSTNPVQNKVITVDINGVKADLASLSSDVSALQRNVYYKDSSWTDATRTLSFTKSDGTTKDHVIPSGTDSCYVSSAWDETNRNLTLTKGDGTSTVHNIKMSENSDGILTFVTTDGTTITKSVVSTSETPYTLYFELSDGTMVSKTIVSETTG